MPGPLVTPRWRQPVAVGAALGLVVVLALAVVVYHGRSTAFDDWVIKKVYFHVGGATTARLLLDVSIPWISIIVLIVLVIVAAFLRRWNVVAFAVLAPLLTVFLTEFVFKPVVGRTLHPAAVNEGLPLSVRSVYPSGHEGTAAATAFVLIVVAGQLRRWPRARAGFIALCIVWMLTAGLGLIRNIWHYPTDVIGAIGLAAACVGTTALYLDRFGAATVGFVARAWRGAPARVDQRS